MAIDKFSVQITDLKKHGLLEGLFLNWLQSIESADFKVAVAHFDFVAQEELTQCVRKLEQEELVVVDRITKVIHISVTGVSSENPGEARYVGTEMGMGIKRFMGRFGQQNSVLEGKINDIERNREFYINCATGEGVARDKAEELLSTFMSYLRSNPDRFWSMDLAGYWVTWVQKESQKSSSKTADHQNLAAQNIAAASSFLSKEGKF